MRDFRHYTIHATDGELGHVDDLLIQDRSWAVPAYDCARPIDRAYEARLRAHYGRPTPGKQQAV